MTYIVMKTSNTKQLASLNSMIPVLLLKEQTQLRVLLLYSYYSFSLVAQCGAINAGKLSFYSGIVDTEGLTIEQYLEHPPKRTTKIKLKYGPDHDGYYLAPSYIIPGNLTNLINKNKLYKEIAWQIMQTLHSIDYTKNTIVMSYNDTDSTGIVKEAYSYDNSPWTIGNIARILNLEATIPRYNPNSDNYIRFYISYNDDPKPLDRLPIVNIQDYYKDPEGSSTSGSTSTK